MELNKTNYADELTIEEAEIQLDIEGEVGLSIAKKTLVGRILTGKPLNRAAVKEILAQAWRLNEELQISDMGPDVFLFQFQEAKQAKKVLEDGPWYVMGHLLSLQTWVPEVSVFEVNYDYVSFWIQLHGLPLEYMNTRNAIKVAKLLGEVVSVENTLVEGHLLRPFMRVRVQVNIKKPLVTGFWLLRKDLPKKWIFIKYERLQGFCYNCGVIGHDNKKCSKEKEMAAFNQSKPRYGPNLGVPQARSIVAIVTENTRRISRKKEGETSDRAKEQLCGTTNTDPANTQKSAHAETEMVATFLATNDQFGNSCAPSSGDNCPLTGTKPKTFRPNSLQPPGVSRIDGPITRVDLNSGQVSPGLGPHDPSLLAIQPECIGLKDLVIIMDYPSPQKKGSSLFGCSLSAEEITKCKSFWYLESRAHTSQPTNKERNISPDFPPPAFAQEYYVEFPPEGDEIVPVKENSTTVGQLIHGFHNMVSLKRTRQEEAFSSTTELNTHPERPSKFRVLDGNDLLSKPTQVDAAWATHFSIGAIAAVARDSDGKFVCGLARKISAPSPLSSEALAVREAVTAAYNLDWRRVIFESDCLRLVECCRRERKIPEIQPIVDDILTAASGFVHCGFTWVQRKGNKVAHLVSQQLPSCLLEYSNSSLAPSTTLS
ncbi:Zinc finger, CCHC-type [Sesbania bispinosa]|nr:Zinc finger, CCHC-type [Sesbania bispinosa]